jgi:hypothetical protein
VLVGRMQIFNNWSPYMVSDPDKVWIGLEYFCSSTDDLWKKSDQDMIELAIEETQRMGIISKSNVLDATVIRMEKPIQRISARTISSTSVIVFMHSGSPY